MAETSRVRYFIRGFNGAIRDSNFDLVTIDGVQGWEPAYTQFARGANGPTKVITDIKVIGDGEIGLTPLNSNVIYPRTGTAG